MGAPKAGAACEAATMPLLPHEAIPPMLELLHAREIAALRRGCRLGAVAREARIAELRGYLLELLAITKFPFTHAAFVLGLNGSYYSYDTASENHYGIPARLPETVCQLFRLAVPDVAFTTVRLQKLAASANFGGKHRTLAFSLDAVPSSPRGGPDTAEDTAATAEATDDIAKAAANVSGGHGDYRSRVASDETETGNNPQGFALCLGTRNCVGGRGEVCRDISDPNWRVLTVPSPGGAGARWAPFSQRGWLQWHWPTAGDMFVVLVTCESSVHSRHLKRHERLRMAQAGFLLPEFPENSDGDAEGENAAKDACCDAGRQQKASRENGSESAGDENEDPGSRHNASGSPRRRSAAAVAAARRVLGLASDAPAGLEEVEEAFRRTARAVHPDRGGGSSGGYPDASSADSAVRADPAADMSADAAPSHGWAMAQVAWARRVLRDAAHVAAASPTSVSSAGFDEDGGGQVGEVLMLVAPPTPDDGGQ
eukprot:TRINITY_DN30306_c0_g1_i1.p1 TRINITY_DN30306_c0_g1~~TRINITY_DN30306_c0_g1_i1.p1  ORF type:complete len:500 (+),score=88.21 TRINITY_DN30306_c0_g1_i1:50-1501(+)